MVTEEPFDISKLLHSVFSAKQGCELVDELKALCYQQKVVNTDEDEGARRMNE
jgi:hypothetical protein